MSLTDKQRLFVDAYLVDRNGKQAAIAAGYSPRTAEVQASRLLRHVQVKAAIRERTRAAAASAGITLDMVVAELGRIGFADIRQAVRWASSVAQVAEDPNTGEPVLQITNQVQLVDSAELTEAAAAAIAEVSQTKDGLKVKLHSKLSALLGLARLLDPQAVAARRGGKKEPATPGKPPADEADGDWGGLLN